MSNKSVRACEDAKRYWDTTVELTVNIHIDALKFQGRVRGAIPFVLSGNGDPICPVNVFAEALKATTIPPTEELWGAIRTLLDDFPATEIESPGYSLRDTASSWVIDCLPDVEKFLCKPGLYWLLTQTYRQIVRQRNKLAKILPSKISEIRKIGRAPLLKPAKDRLTAAANNLEETVDFFDEVINVAEKWFYEQGIDPKSDKQPRKHAIWNRIISDLHKILEGHYPHVAKDARLIAQLLAAAYPRIWSPVDDKSIDVVRKRISQLAPIK